MTIHTKLEICNQEGRIIRCYKTKKFTGATNMAVIEDLILKKYPNCRLPLDIQILDQDGGYVTLDGDFLEEYGPFNTKQINATTVQPANSSELTVILRVILPDDILYSMIDRPYMMTLEEASETVDQPNEPVQRMDDVVSTLEPPKHPIPLCKDPKMGFIDGHNVNNKQRDQYICDEVNVDSGETTGTLSMLQGEKNSANKYKRILPRFKIWNDDIASRADHVWTLLVYIVLDVCQFSKRSLFYHSQRTFVQNGNVTEYSNPFEIPITTVDWRNDMEIALKLKTVVIPGAKKHSNVPPNLICEMEDIDTSEIFDSSCNYTKSRLALVLREDHTTRWETLVLSNEMDFEKKPDKFNITNILDHTASSKRRRSKKCHTIADRSVKRRKIQRAEDHSSLINSSVLPNQGLLINYNNNQVENSTGIENSYGDIMNIRPNDFDFSDIMIMDSNALITSDPSLNLAAFFNINSPNL